LQADERNSDEDAPADSIRGEIFSANALAENVIRMNLTQIRQD
jgi:hypothetical protein